MKIVTISDTHNRHKELDLGSGDILIHSGDATGRGTYGEIKPFLKWYGEQDFTYKIFVAGNHDWGFEREPKIYEEMCKKYGIIYLNDSGYTIKDFDTGNDIKIWGSPVQPKFCNWAFNRDIFDNIYEGDPYHGVKWHPWIKPHWDKIPNDTDILITHGPPEGILDEVTSFRGYDHVGCPHLREAILDRIKPKLHVFGHIHDESGILMKDGIMFNNAAVLNDYYTYEYKPRTIEWVQDEPKIK